MDVRANLKKVTTFNQDLTRRKSEVGSQKTGKLEGEKVRGKEGEKVRRSEDKKLSASPIEVQG
jgi:hypothetical protein